MKKISIVFIVVNLVLLLLYINYSIYTKEQTLKDGRLVLLRLAPVDPRSLLQGDYMILNYEITTGFEQSIPPKGFCIITTDNNNVAKRRRFQQSQLPLEQDELAIRYGKADSWSIKIGAESYFFQEGEGEKFGKAKYGGLKIDQDGNSVLVGLYNENFELIR